MFTVTAFSFLQKTGNYSKVTRFLEMFKDNFQKFSTEGEQRLGGVPRKM